MTKAGSAFFQEFFEKAPDIFASRSGVPMVNSVRLEMKDKFSTDSASAVMLGPHCQCASLQQLGSTSTQKRLKWKSYGALGRTWRLVTMPSYACSDRARRMKTEVGTEWFGGGSFEF